MATTTRHRNTKGKRRPPARHARWTVPHVGRPPAEAWGALLVLAGLLDALGTWADLTGPLGRALRPGGGARSAPPGAGLLPLAHGSPPISGRRHAIERAGGYAGALVGGPLHTVLATWGSTLVLLALAAVGALLAAAPGP